MANWPISGAVALFDGGTPRSFTGVTGEVISGGNLVIVSGANNTITGAPSSFVADDLHVVNWTGGSSFNGIALNNAGSGELITVATRGMYIMKAHGSVLQGQHVSAVSSGAVQTTPNDSTVTGSEPWRLVIGRAVSSAGSATTNNYALIDLYT